MFQKLDPLFLSQPRLSIMCFLKKNMMADFKTLKDNTGLSVGNLSIQLNKLKNEDCIEIVKQFKGNYPLTICKITSKGMTSLNDFFKNMKSYEQMDADHQTLSLQ